MDYALLRNSLLFKNMEENEIRSCLRVFKARELDCQKNDLILAAGDNTNSLGLVLSGSVVIERNDLWGNRIEICKVRKLRLFADTYAVLNNETLLFDVRAESSCRVLLLQIGDINTLARLREKWTVKFVCNLLMISSLDNLELSAELFHTKPKTMRGRILSYLNTVALRTHKREFDIPYNRQQMADYLNVERSALSGELSRMQKDGIIKYRKNHFILL